MWNIRAQIMDVISELRNQYRYKTSSTFFGYGEIDTTFSQENDALCNIISECVREDIRNIYEDEDGYEKS